MQISKDKIVEMIKSRGDHEQAKQAESELPENVDSEQDSGLLAKFGIDAQSLPGGIGGKLGL